MIYFVTVRELQRVKIGLSGDPYSRFIKIRTDCPIIPVLERVAEGGDCEERALHRQFEAHHVHGEWFNLAAEIEAHMASLPRALRVAPAGKGRRSKHPIKIDVLAKLVGISRTHASNILSGRANASWRLAAEIYRQTGWKAKRLEGLSDDTVAVIEKCYRRRKRAA